MGWDTASWRLRRRGEPSVACISIGHTPRQNQQGLQEPHATAPEDWQLQSPQPVILVEDEEAACFLYERYLHGCGFQLLIARTVWQARDILRQVRLGLIFLDIVLPGEDAWMLLADLKSHAVRILDQHYSVPSLPEGLPALPVMAGADRDGASRWYETCTTRQKK